MIGIRARKASRAALAAFSGVLAAFAALAFAELASAAVRPESSPVTAVGSAAIDRTPAPVKDWAIRAFGEDDKLVLQLGIVLTLTVFALFVGVIALRFRRLGTLGVLVFGVVGASAAVSRPDGGPWDGLPSVVGALIGAAVLYLLVGALHRAHWLAAARRPPTRGPTARTGTPTRQLRVALLVVAHEPPLTGEVSSRWQPWPRPPRRAPGHWVGS